MKTNVLFLVLVPFFAFSQANYAEAIINWRHTDKIELYSMPNGTLIETPNNDNSKGDYLSLKIFTETNDYFYVEMSLNRSRKTYEGWVKKNKHIGAYSRNEEKIQNLTLYAEPSQENSNKIELLDWRSEFITIERSSDVWRFISINHKGKKISGWIEARLLCANNYTSCN